MRIDMPSGMARTAVMPRLPELFATHPQLALEISSTNRRVGEVSGDGLVARPLGKMQMVNCASPA